MTPHELYRAVLAETGDWTAAFRATREKFGLDLRQAKEVMLQVNGMPHSLEEHENRIADELIRNLDEQDALTKSGTGSTPTVRSTRASVARIVVAALCGMVLTTASAAVVLEAMFAAGGYTTEALVEPSPTLKWAIVGTGAGVGGLVGWLWGRATLHPLVGFVSRGTLGGVFAVVAASTLWTAGMHSKAAARPQVRAAVYGVPVGAVSGGMVGWLLWRRGRGQPTGAKQVEPSERVGGNAPT